MVSTCDRGDVYAHELGHNLGMYHASFDSDDDGTVDATCPWGGWSGGGEYCDDSDYMGISTNVWRQTNGPHWRMPLPTPHGSPLASGAARSRRPRRSSCRLERSGRLSITLSRARCRRS